MDRKLVIGIDVSKSQLDYLEAAPLANWASVQSTAVSQVANSREEIELWLCGYCPSEAHFIFEPTGTYSDKLLQLLSRGGYRFSLVKPQKAYHFCRTMDLSVNNDEQAARLLAYMGGRLELPLYEPPTEVMQQRKQLLTAISGLMKQARMVANQIHAQEQYLQPHPMVLQVLKAQHQSLEAHIAQLEAQLIDTQDQEFIQAKELAMSIKGVGPVIAHWVLIMSENLTNFHQPGSLVRFCGVVGRKHRSGTSVDRQLGITKQACAKLRAALFMGAKSAIRYNHACRDLYQRLRAKGKPYYKAMVAVMAKLLKQIFGVVKSGVPFDNDYYLKFQKN